MKRHILLFAVILSALLLGSGAMAQTTVAGAENDSIARAVKLKNLQTKRTKLQNEIKRQDAKRNRQIPGVSAERLEELNDRQDSICLALRSELTEINLEIREMGPAVSSPALVQQYNNLVNHRNKPTQAQEPQNTPNSTDPKKKPAKRPTKRPAKKTRK